MLLRSDIELLRTIIGSDENVDKIPTDCLRIDATNRMIQYVNGAVSKGQVTLVLFEELSHSRI